MALTALKVKNLCLELGCILGFSAEIPVGCDAIGNARGQRLSPGVVAEEIFVRVGNRWQAKRKRRCRGA